MAEEKHVDQKIYTLTVMGATLMIFLIGSVMFFSNFGNRDHGQLWVYGAFFFATVLAGFSSLKKWHFLAVIFTVLSISSIVYSNMKYDWRTQYIEAKRANKMMILEPYITQYPSFETHLFGHYWGAENPVRLSQECLDPMLTGQPTTGKCGSFQEMLEAYNMDVRALMAVQYQKMRDTAKKIKEGQMKTAGEYAQCLNSKQCAPVPLLPKDVKAETIDVTSAKEHFEVRKAYWSLINDEQMSAAVCAYMPLCVALSNGKLIDAKNPMGVTIR